MSANIHDRARQLQRQSPRPMDLSEAYAELGRRAARRRVRYGSTTITATDLDARARVESPSHYRLPYADT